MKKLKNLIFLLAFFFILTNSINVFAYTFNTNDISKNTYVIGKTMYTREKVGNYVGSLTTKYIMLASKTIDSDEIQDMNIYYKNSSGQWIDAITNDSIDNMVETVEITNKNGQKFYTVTFDYGDNNVKKEGYIKSEKIKKPTDPTKDGYIFNGWYLDNEKFDFDNYELTNDITLKAIWFANNSLASKVTNALIDNTTTTCSNLMIYQDGTTYLSGNDSCINFNYVKYSDKLWRIVAINNDGTIKMITDDSVKEVNSSVFEANSDSDYFYDISKKNDSTYFGSNIYKYLNNEFLSTLSNYKNVIVSDSTWNDGNEAETILDNIVKKLPTNTIINNSTIGKDTPVGLLNSYEYYLSYKNTMSASSTHLNTSSYLNNNSNWWLINGGYVSSEGGALFDLGMGTYSVRPVINLLKDIEPSSGSGTKNNPYLISGLDHFIVSFNTDGGSSISNQKIEDGKTITIPTNPTKEGYTFSKWQLNGEDFDTNTPITSDIELKAVWTINTYTVTFKDNDEVISTASVQYNGKVTKIDNPTKTGYTFSKWQLNGKDFDFDTQITNNIELNAVWTKNEYVVQIKNIDNFTVDCELIVTENGKEITVKEIKRKSDSESLGSGSHIYINKNEIASLDEFIVVLEDDTEVEAKKAS